MDTRAQVETAQGSSLSWGGFAFTNLVEVEVASGEVTLFDRTHMGCGLLGSGWNARIVRQVDPVAVSPATVTAKVLGLTGVGIDDRGDAGILAVRIGSGSISGKAVLLDFKVTGAVGELLETVLTFQFLGVN